LYHTDKKYFIRDRKDIAKGDTILVITARGREIYVVDKVYVMTNPEDVKRPAFAANAKVTCYPFYCIGSAPHRDIVQASLRGAGQVPTQRIKGCQL
jgi:sortase A